MYVVTGASGHLGSQIVDHLLARVPAGEVAVSVRDPATVAGLAGRGVRVREGDFLRPESLEHAFEGARQVLVVSASIRGDDAVAANRAAIDAARAVGATRILYTSHQAAAPDSLFAPQRVHAAVEAHLAQQDVPYTALRNGFYVSTLGLLLAGALETGRVVAPQDGPVSWTAHPDLAEVAACALVGRGGLDGVTPALTAPAMLDLAEVAAILSELTGRDVTRVVVSDEEWAAGAVARGVPAPAAEFTLGIFRAARAGEFAVFDPTLERVLGRRAAPARSYLETLVAAGA